MVPASKERLIEEMTHHGYVPLFSEAIIGQFSSDYTQFRLIAPEVARLGIIAVPFLKDRDEALLFFLDNHSDLLETWGNLWREDKSHFTSYLEIDKILKKCPEPNESIWELINRIVQYFCEISSQFPYNFE